MTANKLYSELELLKLSNKTLAILGRDAENGSVYAVAVLKEIFNNSKGIRPTTGEHQTRTRTVTTRRMPNHEVPEAIQHSS